MRITLALSVPVGALVCRRACVRVICTEKQNTEAYLMCGEPGNTAYIIRIVHNVLISRIRNENEARTVA